MLTLIHGPAEEGPAGVTRDAAVMQVIVGDVAANSTVHFADEFLPPPLLSLTLPIIHVNASCCEMSEMLRLIVLLLIGYDRRSGKVRYFLGILCNV